MVEVNPISRDYSIYLISGCQKDALSMMELLSNQCNSLRQFFPPNNRRALVARKKPAGNAAHRRANPELPLLPKPFKRARTWPARYALKKKPDLKRADATLWWERASLIPYFFSCLATEFRTQDTRYWEFGCGSSLSLHLFRKLQSNNNIFPEQLRLTELKKL